MKWTDVQLIAETLCDNYGEIDPKKVNFVDLHNMIITLEDFHDDHSRGGGKSAGGDTAGLDRRGGLSKRQELHASKKHTSLKRPGSAITSQ